MNGRHERQGVGMKNMPPCWSNLPQYARKLRDILREKQDFNDVWYAMHIDCNEMYNEVTGRARQ